MYRLIIDAAGRDTLLAAMHAYDSALLDAMGKMRDAGLGDALDAVRDGPRAALLALMQIVDDAPKGADGDTCTACNSGMVAGPGADYACGLCPACADGDGAPQWPNAALLAALLDNNDAAANALLDAMGSPMRVYDSGAFGPATQPICPDCRAMLYRLPAIGHGRAAWGCKVCNPDFDRG